MWGGNFFLFSEAHVGFHGAATGRRASASRDRRPPRRKPPRICEVILSLGLCIGRARVPRSQTPESLVVGFKEILGQVQWFTAVNPAL